MKKTYLFFLLAIVIFALSIYGVNRLAYNLIFQKPIKEEIPIITENPEINNSTDEKIQLQVKKL